ELPIWKTTGSRILPASKVLAFVADSDLIPEASPEFVELQSICIDALQRDRLKTLMPMFSPVKFSTFLSGLVRTKAKDGVELKSQVQFLSTVERVSRVCALLEEEENDQPLPRVNAMNCLSFSQLYVTDASTYELLDGTTAQKELLHP